MNATWPLVNIGDVLKLRRDRLEIVPGSRYKRITVRLGGLGVVLRDEVDGSDIRTEVQFVARKGQFVFSKIDARNGAFGIIPDALDKSVVSGNFLTFDCLLDRVIPRFLQLFVSRHGFWEECARISEGTTNRVPVRIEHFLQLQIPLPPLVEQQQLVARVEELASQIREALTLRHQAAEQADALVAAHSAQIFRAASRQGTVPLASVATLERGRFSRRPRNDPRFFGGAHPWIQIGEIEAAGKRIRAWSETLNDEGLAISKKFPKGTVLISIAATIGSVGILDFDCCVPDSIVGVTPLEGTDSEFLYYYLTYIRGHLEDIAPQSAQKNINLQILSPLPVPALSLSEQRRFVAELDALQAEVGALEYHQAKTAAELDALLPSLLDRAFKGDL